MSPEETAKKLNIDNLSITEANNNQPDSTQNGPCHNEQMINIELLKIYNNKFKEINDKLNGYKSLLISNVSKIKKGIHV